jgi:hypothetical protein
MSFVILGCRIAYKGAMDRARGGVLYIKYSVVQWKDMRPWQPDLGPEEKHFVSGNFAGVSCIFRRKDQRSDGCDGWAAWLI